MPAASKVRALVDAHLVAGVSADVVVNSAGHHKDYRTTLVRWAVFKRLREDGYSLTGIARRFNMDHSSVAHALNQIRGGKTPYCGVHRGPRKRVLTPRLASASPAP